MGVKDSRHPEYSEHVEDWQEMRHTVAGQTAMKMEGNTYLPMPSGFKTQSDGGKEFYANYILRARFPEVVLPTLVGMAGLIHRSEAQIEMPAGMEFIWERATKDGLPLEAFHARITHELIQMGRYAVLVDADDEGAEQPYLAGYSAESLVNWFRDGLFVLNESGWIIEDYNWRMRERYRELRLEGGNYVQRLYGDGEDGQEITPTRRAGGGRLDHIPIVVANAQDVTLDVMPPPLMPVARAAKAIYQLDADYRWQLYMSGQETLFIIGSKEIPTAIGAGVVYGLDQGADAKYVGPSGSGIAAHRTAIEDAKQDAINAGASLFDRPSGQESGEALRLRYAAQTATLKTIAEASAKILEASLRNLADFLNLDRNKVIVKPNKKFMDTTMTPAEAVELTKLWMQGALSKVTIYENLQRGEIASPERTFEEEEELIEAEAIDRPQLAAPTSVPGVPPASAAGNGATGVGSGAAQG